MDISNAGEPVILPTARILPEARGPLAEAAGPSNRVNAVGQLAKSAVQDARESGIELPKNAQGYAASQIARGADPESVFSALVSGGDSAFAAGGAEGADETTDGGTAEAAAGADEADGEEDAIAAVDDAEPSEDISPFPEDDEILSAAETALSLLEEDQVA